jgi:hypothetical protein
MSDSDFPVLGSVVAPRVAPRGVWTNGNKTVHAAALLPTPPPIQIKRVKKAVVVEESSSSEEDMFDD